MASASEALAPEDRELLERLAGRVVELRLEVPAILALETGLPLSLVASNTMTFFEPMVQAIFRFPDYRRFAALVERREAIEALTAAIERRAEEARQARRDRGRTAAGPATSPTRRAPRG
jgi:hypothetical protein